MKAYGQSIFRSLRKHFGNRIPETIIEPGRGMVGNAGIIEAEVVLISKKSDDDKVGALVSWLDSHHEADHTVVIVAADHGETLGEGRHMGHQGLLVPEVLHIPLIIYAPGMTPRHVTDDVSLLDVAPTVLERLRDEARQLRRRRADERIRRLPVRLSVPLVLCTLPSFALLTVVPMLLAALTSLRR